MRAETPRIGYVVKRYPRFSETFIVNEILAHEAAGVDVEVFALYPPNDTHFQDAIARVRAPVTYLTAEGLRAADLWGAIQQAGADVPGLWSRLELARGSEARAVYQGALLSREVRRRGITHLHAHFATVAAEVARLGAGWSGVPYTVTAHAKDIFHESVTAVGLRRVLGDASHVVTVSDHNVEYLTSEVGLAAGSVRRIYNGIDLARFAWQAPAADAPPHIMFVGRFVEKKGLQDLVEACAVLRARGVDHRCTLVGGGPLEGSLRALVEARGLGETVHFAGPRPQAEVIAMVGQAAVFAAPCRVADDGDRDGLPTVLLEAMALGTPVVATDVVGIPEVVRHEDTGLLVPERNAEALADALSRLLGEPSLRRRLSFGARALMEGSFDVVANAAAMRALFSSARAPRHLARAS
jgi:colanic acid/amylovoran biosynthesis glycosyltransferase